VGIEDNKQLVRTFFADVVEKGQVGLLDDLTAADMVDHLAEDMGWKPGRDGFVQHIEWLHSAVSVSEVTVDDLIAEGDRVVAYWTLRATHTGDLYGVPATGREFTGTAISRITLSEGRITDYLVRADVFGVLQALGAIPS
jgi:predicted ester cyclase